jgi:hypothetical protein
MAEPPLCRSRPASPTRGLQVSRHLREESLARRETMRGRLYTWTPLYMQQADDLISHRFPNALLKTTLLFFISRENK